MPAAQRPGASLPDVVFLGESGLTPYRRHVPPSETIVTQARVGPIENLQPSVNETNCVFHNSDNTWGKDFRISVTE